MQRLVSYYTIMEKLVSAYLDWKAEERDNIAGAWMRYSKVLLFACDILDVNTTDMHIELSREFERVIEKNQINIKFAKMSALKDEMLIQRIWEGLKCK